MNAETQRNLAPRQLAARAAPFVIVALAGIAARSPLVAIYPLAAALLFLWIVSDTMMLALIARAPKRRPARHAVLGTLAGASITVWFGSPAALRQALSATPPITAMMLIAVLGHVAWGTLRAGRIFRAGETTTGDRWLAAASEVLPPMLVRLAAAELTILHMALFRWGGPADVPANCRGFSYHKHLTPMCATLLILSGIEVAVYHLLVGHWSRTAALVMFVLSDLGLVYLVGLIKSFRFRPVLLTPDGVCVRAGILINQPIPLDLIVDVETGFSGEAVRDPATLNAALLAWPNILLKLNGSVGRRSLLKRKRAFRNIAFRLDDPEPFIRLLRWRLGQRAS
ncbi:hypothetical protein [Sphingomonas bacterium]|uniref:hypothetical protein n=1 Tax=Sphingomonas bacterium TaxID=1895847 RepID=UPI001575878E|nr:hypothetical protein [Sphingomonas bacterium]